MLLNTKRKQLKKKIKVHDLSNIEYRIIALLSNGKRNSFSSFRKFVYNKNNITDETIMNKVKEVCKKYNLNVKVNNFGCQFSNGTIIEIC